jgi:hypothetical protein
VYREGRIFRGSLDVCHSAITIAAHKAGFSIDKTLSLFNAATYKMLGYLDLWDGQRKILIERFARHGIDIAAHFIKWSRNDCFMYSTDHPKIEPIYDVVKIMLKSKGIKYDEHGILPSDSLKYPPMYAIYKEIAENLGVKGSYWFKGVGPVSMSLEQFIVSSFKVYDEIPGNEILLPKERHHTYELIAGL